MEHLEIPDLLVDSKTWWVPWSGGGVNSTLLAKCDRNRFEISPDE